MMRKYPGFLSFIFKGRSLLSEGLYSLFFGGGGGGERASLLFGFL